MLNIYSIEKYNYSCNVTTLCMYSLFSHTKNNFSIVLLMDINIAFVALDPGLQQSEALLLKQPGDVTGRRPTGGHPARQPHRPAPRLQTTASLSTLPTLTGADFAPLKAVQTILGR